MSRYISEAKVRHAAEKVLSDAGAQGPPVVLDDIARRRGARVVRDALETDLSGVLHMVDGTPLIAVNSAHSQARQRFTIAHEVGHLVLHGPQTFVDRRFVFRRDQKAATGSDREEIQANMFAAEVLMPRDWLLSDVGDTGFDMGGDDALRKLARRYGVSQSAMAFRLANLRLTAEQ